MSALINIHYLPKIVQFLQMSSCRSLNLSHSQHALELVITQSLEMLIHYISHYLLALLKRNSFLTALCYLLYIISECFPVPGNCSSDLLELSTVLPSSMRSSS